MGAEKALKYMDGGQIDGQQIRATAVPPPGDSAPRRRMQSLPPDGAGQPHRGEGGRFPLAQVPEALATPLPSPPPPEPLQLQVLQKLKAATETIPGQQKLRCRYGVVLVKMPPQFWLENSGSSS